MALVASTKLRYIEPRFTIPVFSRSLSLAIPPWVGDMTTGDGFGHRWGRNSKFCIAVGTVTRTAGILAFVGIPA